MSKRKQVIENVENIEKVEDKVENLTSETEQAVGSDEISAKQTASQPHKEKENPVDLDKNTEIPATETVVVQKSGGGKAIGLLALLVALGVGGAGYYFGMQKFAGIDQQVQQQVQQQVAKLSANLSSAGSQTAVEMPTFEAEKAQINELATSYQKALDRIAQLESEQSNYTNQINNLQLQIQKLGNTQTDSSAWKLADANFLLNNALRKLVLDNDLDTAKSLLLEANGVLNQVTTPEGMALREAIKADLNNLSNVNQVDQNGLMLRLTALANKLDDLPMIENESADQNKATGEVSDSIQDWEKNLEKSASSFLDHFIRVSDRNAKDEKAFVAPNQEIYLRENIRLRLQIAILAIPRQQNELYKRSLEAVSTWIRSYFDTQNENVKNFLKELDELVDQSIYIDAPTKLESLNLLDKQLSKTSKPVEKMEIQAEKELAPVAEPQPAEPQADKPAQ
ncbi:HemX protein [Haemophilus paracuniculus]|uniref:HemX protein n=1 Tax=Haemophilus paracuniculus TaxID=734 RepID=A0A1T0ASZ3_9PAST|nr:uroporphyrinogen-III C-methyltransferase [Haemophilus paracuniculus]OOR99609.1 HemX protein [Haemophilus paracuniculus]